MGSVTARAFGLWSPASHHTFALYGGATGLAGDPVASNLASFSHRLILRGFDIDETYHRLGLYAVTEYRHTLATGRGMSTPFFTWIERLQGVLFVGGGTGSNPNNYDGLFTAERLYSEVGYGVRIHTLIFGVQQYILALDLALPLSPTDRRREVITSDGSTELQERDPLKITVGITHTY